jgi:hypothetical protein
MEVYNAIFYYYCFITVYTAGMQTNEACLFISYHIILWSYSNNILEILQADWVKFN